MKKVFWIISFALLAFSCSVEEPATPAKNNDNDSTPHARVYARTEPVVETAANIEDEESKTFANSNMKVVWNANDEISVFLKDNGNQEYRFYGNEGDDEGEFRYVGGHPGYLGLSNVYSVYPYNENTNIDADGVITYNLPSEQIYRENMFGLGANTMVSASTSADNLVFKNLCGYLILKLYGENVTVSAITLEGRNREPLSGPVKITATNDGTPSFTFDSGCSTSITLKCPTPVTLGQDADHATTFWFVVPPTTFTNGIKITVISGDTSTSPITYKKFQRNSKAITIPRNTTYRFKALEVVPVNPNPANTIVEYSASGDIVENNEVNPDGFIGYGMNLSIVDHDFDSGRGTITLNGELSEVKDNFLGDNVESVSLPNSVTMIGKWAFAGCSSLQSFATPVSVTAIGEQAFINCYSLESFTLSDSVITIGDEAFLACGRMSEFSFGNSVATIGANAFEDCDGLNTLYIPNSVTTIGKYAFTDCGNLQSIDLSSSLLITIGEGAFSDCPSLTGISIPNSVTTIGDYAFCDCSSLETLSLGNSVATIGDHAFEGTPITSILIPRSVTTIGDYAFCNCSYLQSLSFRVGSSVRTIGDYAFAYCYSLGRELTFPDSVNTIGEYAFCECSTLESIIIGASVTTIGIGAFNDCGYIETFGLGVNTPPLLSGDIFENCYIVSIMVPPGTAPIYQNAPYWSDYADIIL